MIKNFWENLDPHKKRHMAIMGGAIALFAIVAMFSNEPVESEGQRGRQDTIRHVLTDTNTREIGIDSLSADVKLVARDNDELRRELDRVTRELEHALAKVGASNEVSRELARMRHDLKALSDQTKELAKRVDQGFTGSVATKNAEAESAASGQSTSSTLDVKDPASFFQNAPLPHQKSVHPTGKGEGEGRMAKAGIQIVSHIQEVPVEEEGGGSEEDGVLYLPTGSILTGVLINGMDAPTAQGARRDPFPATLRVQMAAILPNRFRADVRECFLIVSGYGDLSSERAYLRGETLSCVREDGGVIESRLDSYAVGEDGKAGVRGRLVSKQGQIIAKSMMAGFLSGVSDAFDVNPVPVISTNPGDRTQYQSVFSPDVLQGAGVKGASKALDRIAQFYIDMAENIFPVIEVDAGRRIDVIVTRGAKLQIRSTAGNQS